MTSSEVEWVELGSVVTFPRRYRESDDGPESRPVLTFKGLRPTGEFELEDHISQEDARRAGMTAAEPGDTVGTAQGHATGWILKKVGHVSANEVAPFVASTLQVFRPRRELIDDRYLFHVLTWNRTYTAIRELAGPRKSLTPRMLAEVQVPLLQRSDQHRVSLILDRALDVRLNRRRLIFKLESLEHAIFDEMFGAMSDGDSPKLGDVVATTSGGTPSRSRSDYFGGTIPWVKSGELSSGRVTNTEETITEEALANSSAKVMSPGTILLAMYGATVGEVAELEIEAATNQAVCCLTPNELVSGRYLVGFLRSRKRELIGQAAGGAQPNISQTIIRNMKIPVPPKSSQEEFERRVAAVTRTRHRADAAFSVNEELIAVLTESAFRGEL